MFITTILLCIVIVLLILKRTSRKKICVMFYIYIYMLHDENSKLFFFLCYCQIFKLVNSLILHRQLLQEISINYIVQSKLRAVGYSNIYQCFWNIIHNINTIKTSKYLILHVRIQMFKYFSCPHELQKNKKCLNTPSCRQIKLCTQTCPRI